MTEIITMEDHSNRHHVIDTTAVQQQPEDLELTEELNLNNRQDHGMIDIEELFNDWLREVM